MSPSVRSCRILSASSVVGLCLTLAAPLPASAQQAPLQWGRCASEDGLPALRGPEGEVLPFRSHAAVRAFLRDAEIVHREELDIGTTRPERLTLRRDGVTARAIFRHVDERHERYSLGEGPTYMRFYDSALFELAAYHLGCLLGLENIPPVVRRDVAGRSGTVQVWIEDALTDSDRIQEGLEPANFERWIRQRADMEVFDALLYNADRNTGNILYDAGWTLWMIDHTRTFQRPSGPLDLSGVQQISAALWRRLQQVGPEEIRTVLEPLLEQGQIASLLERRTAILEHVRRLIDERDEGAVLLR